MKNISIKWKLSLAFIVLTIGIVVLYILIAKNTFESDKTSYIFDTQERQLSQYAQQFNNQVTRALFDAKAVLIGLDPTTRTLSDAGQRLFQSDASLLAIEFWKQGIPQPILRLEKERGLWAGIPYVASPPGQLNVKSLGKKHFLATLTSTETTGDVQTMRLVFSIENLFDSIEGQTLALTDDGRVILSSSEKMLDSGSMDSALVGAISKDVASTLIAPIKGRQYMISVEPLRIGKFGLAAFIDADEAFRALNVLYQRSMAFLLFSFFATVVISMLLANSLTKHILELSRLAEKVGKGDFSASPTYVSGDEIGILASAFKRMIGEIQNLLSQTADKTRMESELKTARLVQESLYPDKKEYQCDSLRLAGLNVNSSECSGDWWYYYVQGDELYVIVADATGHGTPAALITAAARSLFSYLQRDHHTLREIALLADDAIHQCSKGRVFMTAFLLKLNTRTGNGTFINAGHEPPVLLKSTTDGITPAFLMSQPDPALGEKIGEWLEHSFQLEAGDRVFIFTDGLTAIQNQTGGQIGERRLLRMIAEIAGLSLSPLQVLEEIYRRFDTYGDHKPLADDVTAVYLERFQ